MKRAHALCKDLFYGPIAVENAEQYRVQTGRQLVCQTSNVSHTGLTDVTTHTKRRPDYYEHIRPQVYRPAVIWKLIVWHAIEFIDEQESRAAARKPRDAAIECSFRLKFANNIPDKYKTSHASKATLQSSKHAGAKHNLTQNQDSKSFKVTCLESVEKQ